MRAHTHTTEGVLNPSGYYARTRAHTHTHTHTLLDFALKSNHLPTENSSPPKDINLYLFEINISFSVLSAEYLQKMTSDISRTSLKN